MGTFRPQPFAGNSEQIEQIAGRLRTRAIERLHEGRSPVGSHEVYSFLQAIVETFGGEIAIPRYSTWDEVDGGSLVIEPGGKRFQLRLSPLTSPLRDNFTIAHELGHYLLHYPHKNPSTEQVSFNRYGTDAIEVQANRFAAALLMPKTEFRTKAQQFKRDAYQLAGHFGVSQPAVQVRLGYV